MTGRTEEVGHAHVSSTPSRSSEHDHTSLVGRADEMRVIDRLVGTSAGGAVVISGEAGMGKTALLAWARARAVERGCRVVQTRAVESEAKIQFAGLHELLHSHPDADFSVDYAARELLSSVFSATASIRNLLPVALATTTILRGWCRDQPLLVLADDAHWLDEASLDVLTFVARRVSQEPLAIVIACRSGEPSVLERSNLPALRLGSLDESAASEFLRELSPNLTAARHQQVMREAGGNPLALREMAVAGWSEDGCFLGEPLPLSKRLENGYAARFRQLPRSSQLALVTLALNDSGAIPENLAAVVQATGARSALTELEPAERLGLIKIADSAISFNHPLIRSAVRQTAGAATLQVAHAALAQAVGNRSDRAIWHHAAAAQAPNEDVATALEDAAERAERRQGPVSALRALLRAVELSEDSMSRGRRLIDAAELAWLLGRSALEADLLRDAAACDLSEIDRARHLWAREISADSEGSMPPIALVHLSNRLRGHEKETSDSGASTPRPNAVSDLGPALNHAHEGHEVAADLLLVAAYKLYWHGGSEHARKAVQASIGCLPPTPYTRSHELLVAALLDPMANGHRVVETVSHLTPSPQSSPYELRLYGMALAAIPDFVAARPWLGAAVEGLRAQTGSALLARTLCSSAATAAGLCDWRDAAREGDEGHALAIETGQPRWAAKGATSVARAAAALGELDQAEAWLARARTALVKAPSALGLAELQVAEGQVALAAGRADQSYDRLICLFQPSDPVVRPGVSVSALVDLVEAATHVGRVEEAHEVIRSVERLAAQTTSEFLRHTVMQARAILATDADPEAMFRLAVDDRGANAFTQARVCLAHGIWLRRQRRIAEARTPLRRACDVFAVLAHQRLA